MPTSQPRSDLTLLYVEDNPELREVVSTILRDEGYEVSVASSAAEGLAKLEQGRFDLVISDYALPDHTGAWLLRQARTNGLLGETRALLVTANPHPYDAGGVTVLQKPLDLDGFLKQIAALLGASRQALVSRVSAVDADDKSAADNLIELALYVSSGSASSIKALRNTQRVLRSYDTNRLVFSVHDLSKLVSEAALADRVTFTPTLVKRRPVPRAWILGNLDETGPLTDLLDQAGVAKRA